MMFSQSWSKDILNVTGSLALLPSALPAQAQQSPASAPPPPSASYLLIPVCTCLCTRPQSLVRIPETLVCAMEFINLQTPPEQMSALEEVRKSIVRAFPDLKDKKAFWMRKASILKVGARVCRGEREWMRGCFLLRERGCVRAHMCVCMWPFACAPWMHLHHCLVLQLCVCVCVYVCALGSEHVGMRARSYALTSVCSISAN